MSATSPRTDDWRNAAGIASTEAKERVDASTKTMRPVYLDCNASAPLPASVDRTPRGSTSGRPPRWHCRPSHRRWRASGTGRNFSASIRFHESDVVGRQVKLGIKNVRVLALFCGATGAGQRAGSAQSGAPPPFPRRVPMPGRRTVTVAAELAD